MCDVGYTVLNVLGVCFGICGIDYVVGCVLLGVCYWVCSIEFVEYVECVRLSM